MTWLNHPATLTALVFVTPLLVSGFALFVRELRIERAHRLLDRIEEWQ